MAQQNNSNDSNQWNMPPWLAQALGIGGGAAMLGGGAASLFSPGKNPADAANKYIDQIPGQTQQYYQPYIDAGQSAMGTNQGQYNNLINDPNAVLDKFGQGYKESPGYKLALQKAMAGVNSAAAAGGGLGTLGHQELSAEKQGEIASADYEKYLDHVMNLYGTGLSGNQDLMHQGQNASQNYADLIANSLSQHAAYDYSGQAVKNEQHSDTWRDIIGGAGTAAASIFGGPAGAAALNWLKNR